MEVEAGRLNGLFKGLEDEFKCCICLNLFSSPSALPCGHHMCSGCLQQSLSSNAECPVCKAKVPPRSVHPSRKVAQLTRLFQQMKDAHVHEAQSAQAASRRASDVGQAAVTSAQPSTALSAVEAPVTEAEVKQAIAEAKEARELTASKRTLALESLAQGLDSSAVESPPADHAGAMVLVARPAPFVLGDQFDEVVALAEGAPVSERRAQSPMSLSHVDDPGPVTTLRPWAPSSTTSCAARVRRAACALSWTHTAAGVSSPSAPRLTLTPWRA